MARLKIVSDKPDLLVLGKGTANSLGGFIGILIFGAVACVGLSMLIGDGGDVNPVMIVIFIIIGIVVLISLGNAVSTSTVTLDKGQRLAVRTNGFFFLPTRQQAMPFDKIRGVQVTSARGAGAMASNTLPIWQAQLLGTDDSKLLLNDRGTRLEMDALAARVSNFLSVPVTGVLPAASNAGDAVSGTLNSLMENLGSFAQSMGAGTSPHSPTISAYPSTSPQPAQDDADRAANGDFVAANAPFAVASAQIAAQQAAMGASTRQAEARMAAEQTAAGVATNQTSVRIAEEQADAAADSNATYARMAQEQAAAGASSFQTSAQFASQQVSAFSSDVKTQVQAATQQVSAFSSDLKTQVQAAFQQVTAFSSDTRTQAQAASQQVSAFAPNVQTQAQIAAQQAAAGAAFVDTSVRLAQQQATAQAEMMSSLPPMMSMPYMPEVATFGAGLDIPKFAPLNSSIDISGTALAAPLEIKEMQTQYVSAVTPYGGSGAEPRAKSRPRRTDLGTRDLNKARETYLSALSANPADSAAQNNLGVVYFKQNKMPDAERAFRRTMALDPFTVEGRYNLGLVLQRMGRRSEAREQFRVGAQMGGEGTEPFQQALRGVFQDPLISA